MSSMDEHGAILSVDLAAIAENYSRLATRAAPAQCAAVVKADAYGLGMARVALTLWDAGCKMFFVATLEEGIELRAILGDAEIHVFNGNLAGTEPAISEHQLIPVLNSLEAIDRWLLFQKSQSDRLPVDIHIDTGMSRLGLMPTDVADLAADTRALNGLSIDCILSHLACSDDPANPMNAEQLGTFKNCRKQIAGSRAGLAASSGLFLGREFHFDFVRPGIALYGGNPTPYAPNPMIPVVRLQARILQLRQLEKPRTIGYGATHTVTRPMKIATVAIGYADGYLRAAGNSAVAYVGDVAAPVVGRVSMDLTTIDVTDIPDEQTKPGTLVDMIGQYNPLDDFAAAADTIGYEILTRLGPRLHRRYLPVEPR